MSKSAFYASKESLRKTREEELQELLKLRSLRDKLLNISPGDIDSLWAAKQLLLTIEKEAQKTL